jgi:hypothetical protein
MLSAPSRQIDVGISLSRIILSPEVDMSLRQISFLSRPIPNSILRVCVYSASIALRKYVRERWSPYFPTFKGSAPAVEVSNTYVILSIFDACFRSNLKSEVLFFVDSQTTIDK